MNFEMDLVISDAEISSCHELDEMRQEAERAALQAVERRMNSIIHNAMQKEHDIVVEKNALDLELQNVLSTTTSFGTILAERQGVVRQQLMDMLELQTQLNNVNKDTVNLISSLQDLREQNLATLRADPVYALIQEERDLQQKLDAMGIHVYPPTGSDEHCRL